MIRLFCGYDKREAAGFQVFMESLIHTSYNGESYSVTPMTGQQRDGTNAFTYSRFLIPWICRYQGFAIWLDGSDMMLRQPIQRLWDLRDPKYAVQVVKHDYKTKNPRKYVGTDMECVNDDYPRKNWSSVIIWNCAHPDNMVNPRLMIPLDRLPYPHRFDWLEDDLIGELPVEWNWLAGEYAYNPTAKLVHWTAGIPGFFEYRNADYANEWDQYKWGYHELR